jgi:hypothetical protein
MRVVEHVSVLLILSKDILPEGLSLWAKASIPILVRNSNTARSHRATALGEYPIWNAPISDRLFPKGKSRLVPVESDRVVLG